MSREAFWKHAVSDTSPTDISDLYRRKFDLSDQAIATAGSCFAQHIGRVLRENGFRYLDFEPAPRRLKDADRAAYGYGIYSARYGNVYTARQWSQLFQRAFGEFEPSESLWEVDGRYYDPFRPGIEPGGFGSEEELRVHRAAHFEAVRKLFTSAGVFVFTMGLTETWFSLADGAVFPSVPGSIAGLFDPAHHAFRNMNAGEVLADMRDAIARIRTINAHCRFLLTVSPVPLTATASGKHVLPATIYSKSVLRAVAGQLADDDDGVDYFPSYEIISSHVTRGMFFQPNMREVTRSGVDFVMRHFLKEHLPPRAAPAPLDHEDGEDPFDWTACEEAQLEQFADPESAVQ